MLDPLYGRCKLRMMLSMTVYQSPSDLMLFSELSKDYWSWLTTADWHILI